MTTTVNRETWLNNAVKPLSKMLADVGFPVPEVQVSCGWPGGRSMHKVIGQCWPTKSGKGTIQIFVSPLVNDPHDVLAVLLHELIHAADDCEHQHRGPFVKAMKAVGLVGKPTATVPGEELADRLAGVADRLGNYPHTGMDPSKYAKKQTTRQLKVVCQKCGCICRMSRKAIDELGLPTHCEEEMEEDRTVPPKKRSKS